MRDNIAGGALTETTFLVLLSTFSPNHGYGIMQFIERETKGRVLLGAGTLYGAINSLLEKKWIAPYNCEVNKGKKEYAITEEGKQIAETELRRMGEIFKIASNIIGGVQK